MRKRILSVVLAFVLALSVMQSLLVTANAASAITEQEVINKLASAESKWANGARYIDRLNDGVYTCFGFGRELFYYVFGSDAPISWRVSTARFVNRTQNVKEIGHLSQGYSLNALMTLLAQARPGDLLVASNGNNNHLVVIRSAARDGSSIYVYDANWYKDRSGNPLIRTNARWTANGIRSDRPVGVTLYRYINYANSSSQSNMSNVQSTQTGNWIVSIPQNYKILCYDSAGAVTDCDYRKPRTDAYNLACTQRAVLSNGTVRYRYTTEGGRQFWFDFTSSMSVWSTGSGASTPGVTIRSITSGRWAVTIPANYKALCYSTAGAAASSDYRKPRTSAYNLTCTQRAVLSNGVVRYYYRTGSNNQYEYWFNFISSMSVRNLK